LALGLLATTDPTLLNPIQAVALVADPEKQGDSTEIRWGDAAYGADGIYTKAGIEPQPYIPASLDPHTVTLCNNHDLICAPGFGADLGHASYPQDELESLGAWAESQLNG
jgi:hypothetical protein